MRLVVVKENLHLILTMRERAKILASSRWKEEAFRGVVDAGRRTKTQVQKAVHQQMATRRYSLVVANTRGTPKRAALAYEIWSPLRGQRIEEYKGLQALSSTGTAATRFNAGRASPNAGFVRSKVWNAPRTFKRSFAANGGFFAMLPGGTRSTAPKMLWTFGAKPNQPRSAGGRFASPGNKYGRIRRLFGPSLRNELGEGQSLDTFYRVGIEQLGEKVAKRMTKLIQF